MIVYGTTIAPYVMSHPERALAWLRAMPAAAAGVPGVVLFAALEVDGRGLEVFSPVIDAAVSLPFRFEFEVIRSEDRTTVTTENRVARIVRGLNTVRSRSLALGATHTQYVHADTWMPPGALASLLEVDWPIVGAHVPAYALDGPRWPDGTGRDIRIHMSPGASLLVRNDLGAQIPWRFDPIAGLTDDPAYHHDALALGFPTLVRHDVVCRHYPEHLTPMEARFTEESRLWTPAPPVS